MNRGKIRKSIRQKNKVNTKKDYTVALAGNPNVGKSTVFNALTGLKQHTGNWPGKTVVHARGRKIYKKQSYELIDLPGTYSLLADSAEEEVARDFLCFGDADAVVVVCDATCLQRNLSLVIQTLEITSRVVVCVNMVDEARRKKIDINTKRLEQELGCPVVKCSARSGKGIDALMDAVSYVCAGERLGKTDVEYCTDAEHAIAALIPTMEQKLPQSIDRRWAALRWLEGNEVLLSAVKKNAGLNEKTAADIDAEAEDARFSIGGSARLSDMFISAVAARGDELYQSAVRVRNREYNLRDRKLDRVLTSRWTGIPIMLCLLALVFWITITGANVPSKLLADGLFWIEERLLDFFAWMAAPVWLSGVLISGVYRVLAWVVSVMLPPMAIFFPLFTLLEDFGYLPRVAFNLDKRFKKCRACGKQALTMCMGFGCNAAGVTACRIIHSPRERLIAIITNNFVPCNGRFPTLIAIISMFFGFALVSFAQSVVSALALTGIIVLGVMMTFAVSRLLSGTLLKGEPSSFTLELPPYRCPQLGRVIVRSLIDRTLFVLGRAVVVAAPAGLIIWLLGNIDAGGISLLARCTEFLNPFAQLIGLDGVILMAFILGFPANEIVIPIIIMAYMAKGSILELDSLQQLKDLLVQNGWTWLTAVCTMLFSLMHWPCSTTCLTIKKETGSWKWTAVSFIVPTIVGLLVCFIVANGARLLGLE